jgi:hypothetical protein
VTHGEVTIYKIDIRSNFDIVFNSAIFVLKCLYQSGQWMVLYLCNSSIDFASLHDFNIWFWNCFNKVVFFWLFIFILTHIFWSKKKPENPLPCSWYNIHLSKKGTRLQFNRAFNLYRQSCIYEHVIILEILDIHLNISIVTWQAFL